MFYITENDISHEKKYELKIRYDGVQTVPGIRSNHRFIPDEDILIIKRISNDTINDVYKFNEPKLLRQPINYQPGKYIACYYKTWYIRVILESSNENQGVKVKFMT